MKKRLGSIGHVLGVLFILVWGLAPFYWMLVTALRDKKHTFDTTPWPTHVTMENFRDAMATDKGNDFLGAIGNSLIISLVTTALAVIVGVFTGYALARLNFRGKGLVTGIILAASMFPGIALVTPLFQLFGDLGWIGTYRAMIIPNISFALPLTVYTLISFLRQLPWELEEAARVDGATRGQAFRLVLLPLAAPGIFHSDHRFHCHLERVHAGPSAVYQRNGAGDGGYRKVLRAQRLRVPLRRHHGCWLPGHRAADPHGAGVPAPDRLRVNRWWCEGLTPFGG